MWLIEMFVCSFSIQYIDVVDKDVYPSICWILLNAIFFKFILFYVFFPDPSVVQINPFIRHWEPAKYDRTTLDNAHQRHQATRRRKRDVNYNYYSPQYGPINTIKFNFYAHDR